MEQKPGGTPNPLNPNPATTPVAGVPGPTPNVSPDVPPSKPIQTTSGLQPERPAQPVASTGEPRPVTPASMSRPVRPMRPVSAPSPMQNDGSAKLPGSTQKVVTTRPSAPAQNTGFETLDANPSEQPMGIVTDIDGVTPTEVAVDPMARPMEVAPQPEAPKPQKKKTALLVGMIICLFLAICCGVAAALLFANSNQSDPVAKAVEKLMTGKAPTNVAIDGTIGITSNDMTSPISDAKISLTTQMVVRSMINSSNANIDVNLRNGGSFAIQLDEVYAANGDLYLKVDGITNALSDPYLFQSEALESGLVSPEATEETTTTDIAADQTEEDALLTVTNLLQAFESVDGEWIRIPTDEANSLISDNAEEGQVNCLANLISGINQSSNSISEAYSRNPFVYSTSKDLTVISEHDPIYRLLVDSDKLSAFINETQNTNFTNSLASCLNDDPATLDTQAVVEKLKNLPATYVEVNNDYDFTRIYLEMSSDNEISTTVDLDLSYPSNVNVPEPVEYKDLSSVLEDIFNNGTVLLEEVPSE